MPRRPPNARPLLDDPAWLHQRYITDGARVSDIAKEAGAAPANVWRALARHSIPLRGRVDVPSWVDVLTPDLLESYLDDGYTAWSIAQDLGCADQTVREAMARHQLLDTDPAEDRQLRRWYERDGLTIAEVAERLGMHPRAAGRRLRAAGVQMRPSGRRPQSARRRRS